MIYDCFSFFNELDILEIRLKTLDCIVDKFVLSESNYTHTGQRKPLYFKENESRFSQFKDKIIHVVSPDPEYPDKAKTDIKYSWLCENRQRNSTIISIENILKPDDILIVSDLDEIPNPAALKKAISLKQPVRLRQKMYYYYLNYRCCTSPFWNVGSVVLSYKTFKNPATYKKTVDSVAFNLSENARPTATKVRALYGIKMLNDGGWHFSYIGKIENIMLKTNSIADGNRLTDAEFIEKCIKSGNDIYDRGEWFFAEKIDDSFPSTVVEFPEFIFPISDEYRRSVRLKRLFAYFKWIIRPLAWKLFPKKLASYLSHKFKNI